MTRREIEHLLYNAVAEALGVTPPEPRKRRIRATPKAARAAETRVASASRQLETA